MGACRIDARPWNQEGTAVLLIMIAYERSGQERCVAMQSIDGMFCTTAARHVYLRVNSSHCV